MYDCVVLLCTILCHSCVMNVQNDSLRFLCHTTKKVYGHVLSAVVIAHGFYRHEGYFLSYIHKSGNVLFLNLVTVNVEIVIAHGPGMFKCLLIAHSH
jgi:hypothetical protein